jgi:WS/DGAT/MGAT family acyltransferase
VVSQALDRARPLWEMWLVEDLSEDRFALLSKTHHALIDGISGVDIATVLFDASPDPLPVAPVQREWVPRPLPSDAQLLADALLERATVPAEIVRGARATLHGPRRVAGAIGQTLGGVGALARVGLRSAPPSPLNVRIGPHRRFTGITADLRQFKDVKNAFGGTVNDVVLAAVGGALGRYLRRHGPVADDARLRAMVPVSVRADEQRGALGNQVAAMWARLPIGLSDPVERLAEINLEMDGAKESGQTVGAQALTELTGFAPPTIVAQAARLQERQRLFNLVVTNVPGPQLELYVLGRPLRSIFPMVPLAANQALGVAIMSYDGRLFFGCNADYDALTDLEPFADDLRAEVAELVAAAGARPPDRPPARSPARSQPRSAVPAAD